MARERRPTGALRRGPLIPLIGPIISGLAHRTGRFWRIIKLELPNKGIFMAPEYHKRLMPASPLLKHGVGLLLDQLLEALPVVRPRGGVLLHGSGRDGAGPMAGSRQPDDEGGADDDAPSEPVRRAPRAPRGVDDVP